MNTSFSSSKSSPQFAAIGVLALVTLTTGCASQISKSDACEEMRVYFSAMTAAQQKVNDAWGDEEKKKPHLDDLDEITAEVAAMAIADGELSGVVDEWVVAANAFVGEMSLPDDEITRERMALFGEMSVITAARVFGVCGGITVEELDETR